MSNPHQLSVESSLVDVVEAEVSEILFGFGTIDNPFLRRGARGLRRLAFGNPARGASNIGKFVSHNFPGRTRDRVDANILRKIARAGLRAGVPDLKRRERDLANTPYRLRYHERRQQMQDRVLGGHWVFAGGRPIFVEADSARSARSALRPTRPAAKSTRGRPIGFESYKEVERRLATQKSPDGPNPQFREEIYQEDVALLANTMLLEDNYSLGALKRGLKDLQRQVERQQINFYSRDSFRTSMQQGMAEAFVLAITAREAQMKGVLRDFPDPDLDLDRRDSEINGRDLRIVPGGGRPRTAGGRPSTTAAAALPPSSDDALQRALNSNIEARDRLQAEFDRSADGPNRDYLRDRIDQIDQDIAAITHRLQGEDSAPAPTPDPTPEPEDFQVVARTQTSARELPSHLRKFAETTSSGGFKLKPKVQRVVDTRQRVLRGLLVGNDPKGELRSELGEKFLGFEQDGDNLTKQWDPVQLLDNKKFRGALSLIEQRTGKTTDYLTRKPGKVEQDWNALRGIEPPVTPDRPAPVPGAVWDTRTGKWRLPKTEALEPVRAAQEELRQNAAIYGAPFPDDFDPDTVGRINDNYPNTDFNTLSWATKRALRRMAKNEPGSPWARVVERIERGIKEDLKAEIADLERDPEDSSSPLRSWLRGNFDPVLGAALIDLANQEEGSRRFRKEMRDRILEESTEHFVEEALENKFNDLFGLVPGSVGNPKNVAAQLAVRDEFGINLDIIGADPDSPIRKDAEELYQRTGIDRRAWLRAMYTVTQERLQAKGVEHVTLYRGVKLRATDPGWGGAVEGVAEGEAGLLEVDLNPMNSFTTDLSTATVYGMPGGTSQRGAVVAITVPRERILSVAGEGIGSPWHEEVMILGDRNVPVRIYRVTEQDVIEAEGLPLEGRLEHEGYQNFLRRVNTKIARASNVINPDAPKIVRPPQGETRTKAEPDIMPDEDLTPERLKTIDRRMTEILREQVSLGQIRTRYHEADIQRELLLGRGVHPNSSTFRMAENEMQALARAYRLQKATGEAELEGDNTPILNVRDAKRTPQEEARLLAMLNRVPVGPTVSTDVGKRVASYKSKLTRDNPSLAGDALETAAIEKVASDLKMPPDQVRSAYFHSQVSFNAIDIYLQVERAIYGGGMTRGGAFRTIARELDTSSPKVEYWWRQVAENKDFFKSHIAPFQDPSIWDYLSRQDDEYQSAVLRAAAQRNPDLDSLLGRLEDLNELVTAREYEDMLDTLPERANRDPVPMEFARRFGGNVEPFEEPFFGDDDPNNARLLPGKGRGSTQLVWDPGADEWKHQVAVSDSDVGYEVPGGGGLAVGESEWISLNQVRDQRRLEEMKIQRTGKGIRSKYGGPAARMYINKGTHPDVEYKFSRRAKLLSALYQHELIFVGGLSDDRAAIAAQTIMGGRTVSKPLPSPVAGSRRTRRNAVHAVDALEHPREFTLRSLREVWEGRHGEDRRRELLEAMVDLGQDVEQPFFNLPAAARRRLPNNPLDAHLAEKEYLREHQKRLLTAVFKDIQGGVEMSVQDLSRAPQVGDDLGASPLPDPGALIGDDAARTRALRARYTNFVDQLGKGFPEGWSLLPDFEYGKRIFAQVDYATTNPAEVRHAEAIGAEIARKGGTLVVTSEDGSAAFARGALAAGGTVEVHIPEYGNRLSFLRTLRDTLGPQDLWAGKLSMKEADWGEPEVIDDITQEITHAAKPGADAAYRSLVMATHPATNKLDLDRISHLAITSKAAEQADSVFVYSKPARRGANTDSGFPAQAVRVAKFLDKPVWDIRTSRGTLSDSEGFEEPPLPSISDLGTTAARAKSVPEGPSTEELLDGDAAFTRLKSAADRKGISASELENLLTGAGFTRGQDVTPNVFRTAQKAVNDWKAVSPTKVAPVSKEERDLLWNRHGRLMRESLSRKVPRNVFDQIFHKHTQGDRRKLTDDKVYEATLQELQSWTPDTPTAAGALADTGVPTEGEQSLLSTVPPELRDVYASRLLDRDLRTQLTPSGAPTEDRATVVEREIANRPEVGELEEVGGNLRDQIGGTAPATPLKTSREIHDFKLAAYSEMRRLSHTEGAVKYRQSQVELREHQKAYNRSTMSALEEFREFGGPVQVRDDLDELTAAAAIERATALGGQGAVIADSRSEIRRKFDAITAFFPSDWLESINAEGGLILLELPEGSRPFHFNLDGRSHIAISKGDPSRSYMHELMHAVVVARPSLYHTAINYLETRAGRPPGVGLESVLQSPRDVSEDLGAIAFESSRFVSNTGLPEYQALIYSDNVEILPMLIESLWSRWNMNRNAGAWDPDLEAFILGILARS